MNNCTGLGCPTDPRLHPSRPARLFCSRPGGIEDGRDSVRVFVLAQRQKVVMAIPEYQTFMAPVLRALQDGQPHLHKEIREVVAREMGITEAERQQLIKSGVPVFDSRVGWAVTYMVQAGLVRRPRRGVNQITDRGFQVLTAHPQRVDNHILDQFEEFREFRTRARPTHSASEASPAPELHATASASSNGSQPSQGAPRETITAAVEENNAAVATDLLMRLRDQDLAFLENLVLKVLKAMGYGGATGNAKRLGRSGDEGLDGVIRQDPLGLDRIYVQAKRYAADRTVGRPDIQGFIGALHGAQADRGVFIRTSRFSPDAYSYADRVAARVILIDGTETRAVARQAQHRSTGRGDLRAEARRRGLLRGPVARTVAPIVERSR
jgi:restriction system protein